jgi:hypothetical protein
VFGVQSALYYNAMTKERNAAVGCSNPFVLSTTMKIKVECYSGCKANERPVRFYMGDRVLEVRELLDRWVGEEADYFKLVADDGNNYILRYDRHEDSWELTLYSAADTPVYSKGKVIYLDQARKTKSNRSRHS